MSDLSRIDGHTLSWVKSEIDSTMDNARKALEAYVETPDDESQLRFCLNYLHQVYGTLQMVELYGAGMLAQELETITQALIDNQINNREDAFEAMMRGMMKLPDYLEKLQSGQADYPIILLPLLNDLRAARSAAFLSESALFSPNLDVDAPAPSESSNDSIDSLVGRFRHVYHLGLLDWFRGSDFKMGIKRIGAVIDRLRPSANDPDTSRVLWAASGVAEGLKDSGIESSVAVKQLMGQVDRQFKRIIDEGEFALTNDPPKDLLKNLLYYVATSNSKGERVNEIKMAFDLAEIMPDTETLERARADLSAPNAALMKTVSSVLLEDLTQVKDNLDVFVRSDERDPTVLVNLCGKLAQMGDTLDMLGFGEQRMILRDQISIMQDMANSKHDIEENVLMDVAGALLSIEGALNEPTSAYVEGESTEEFSSEDSIIHQFADPEQRKLVKRVVDEVKVDLSRIKESFNDYTRMPKNIDVLKEVPNLLDRIRGSLSMLTLNRAADILKHCSRYVLNSIIAQSNRPEQRTLDLLADTISSVEYYLESLTESWGHPSAILDVAERSLNELGVLIPEEVIEPEDAAIDSELEEPEHTLVDLTAPDFEDDLTREDISMSDLGGESTLELDTDSTEPEIDISAMELEEQSELSGEFSLEGYDEAAAAMAPESTSDDIQEPYATQEPHVEGDISQGFNLPVIETEDVKPEPAPEPVTQKSPARPAPTSLADELDDEIVEIFLEEAEEEQSNISRLLPRWQNNPDDEESLKDLRRSFHTLKGSGRLVGANDVGEFAWAFENMLNRVIDRTIEPSSEMYGILDQARENLPGLLNLFRQGEKPGQEMYSLMEKAEAVSKGEVVQIDNLDREQLEKTLTQTSEEADASHDSQTDDLTSKDDEPDFDLSLSDDGDSEENLEIPLPDFDASNEADSLQIDSPEDTGLELDGLENVTELGFGAIDSSDNATVVDLGKVDVPEVQAPREEADPLEIEGIELELDDADLASLEADEALQLEDANLPEPILDNISGTTSLPAIDPVLLGIYRKEIGTHLAALRQYIDGWESNEDRTANPKLIRALHTLKGSSRTASVPQVAELCGFLEEHAKYLEENKFDVDHELVNLFEEAGGFIAETVDKLDLNEELPSNTDLIKQTRELLDKTRYESPTMQIHLPETMQEILADDIDESEKDVESASSADVIADDGSQDGSQAMQAALAEAMADSDYDEELLEIFLEEGVEILDESDHTLNEWIEEPASPEHLKALQRQLHTLKGGARMAGVTEIGDLSHSIETMLTAIVDNKIEVTDDMFKAIQKGQDELVKMLEQVRKQEHLDPASNLIIAITALAKSESYDVSALESIANTAEEQNPTDEILASDLPDFDARDFDNVANSEAENNLTDGVDNTTDSAFAAEFSSETNANKTSTEPGLGNVVPLGSAQLPLETSEPSPVAEATEKQKQAQQRAKGDLIRVRSDLLDNLVNFAGEVSIYRSRMEQQTNAFRYNLTELDDTVERFREQLRNFEIEAEAQIQYRTEESGSVHHDFDPLEFDRFTQMQTLSRGMLESLNDLNSLRGILSNLTRESETLLLQQSRVNTDLQEGLMRTRMVPISGQVPRMRRIVRQTAEELGKNVEFQIEGSENELDRTILERIMSPIEHMLRNAIAHGLEMPEQRSEAGKDKAGNIVLSFAREGSDVVISVRDDGAGIDLDAIQKKAIERGILKADADVRKEDLLDIILESGFSTADEITQISGRGVGMDVVSNEIKQLGGLLEIKTEKGVGTIFNINMPLSLSVTRALMITVDEETYAIPLLGVETVERVSREEIARMQTEKGATYHWLDNEYQYINLGNAMGLNDLQAPPEDISHLPVLLVRSGEYRAAIHVDGLIGSREIVVKPVGPQLSTLRGISGATVMGDGSVVLILDLAVLIRLTSITHEEAFADTEYDVEDEMVLPEEKRMPLIMVVDDSITVRKVTTRLLERNNFKTVSAKDGVDALAQLQDYTPDVMLLDVEMPRMDGFELATNIRNDDVINELPIIMITSRTGQKHRDRAMKIGVNTYMGKPYSESELLENIENLLGQKD
ncbi:Signal transduction histidine kinase CheA [hydrothermal vent metagenome]|uniref:histidine kinase n=1 Tax=hydrothermal vent metagenome TaxID=652676 RepID=A0A3B1A3Y1_9ZZZZ